VGLGAATPARVRGKSRTTASRVGSGVGCRSEPRSAEVARGLPPHATHNNDASMNVEAKKRPDMQG
jgi:hypothetical protein